MQPIAGNKENYLHSEKRRILANQLVEMVKMVKQDYAEDYNKEIKPRTLEYSLAQNMKQEAQPNVNNVEPLSEQV